jgi:phosphoribosylformylglycinamidine (FGAM) synthase-like amidotransferase family enzyme
MEVSAMNTNHHRTLVLTGDGINCEKETIRAFEAAGSKVTLNHVNDFLEHPEQLLHYSILALPGGFSFGDELRSGKILAEKMRSRLKIDQNPSLLDQFLKQGGLIIGICNGFQVLMQLGVFGPFTLATNDHHEFRNFWTELKIPANAPSSPWINDLPKETLMTMPVRHKEGRIVVQTNNPHQNLTVAFYYPTPINGSYQNAAAILDATGQILGIMPHPEAATHPFLHPEGLSTDATTNAKLMNQLFRSAVKYKANEQKS